MARYGLVDIRMRDAAHSGVEADYGLSGKLRTDWYAERAEKIYRQRPLRAQILGAKPARPSGPRLRRVSADAAEACFAIRIRSTVSVLSFFPSLFNTPPRRGGHRKTPLCGDFRCRDLRLRQARRKLLGICLYAAMRSAGASLWRLTKPPPFLPRMGDSFFRKERSKEHTKSTEADFVRGRLLAAHPATPEIGKKMLPASKIPGGYSRPMPRLCRGEFYGQRASENSGNFP